MGLSSGQRQFYEAVEGRGDDTQRNMGNNACLDSLAGQSDDMLKQPASRKACGDCGSAMSYGPSMSTHHLAQWAFMGSEGVLFDYRALGECRVVQD